MKKYFITFNALLLTCTVGFAQKIHFEEYDLPNGLHVILHQDHSAPVVTTTVMYHVGAQESRDLLTFSNISFLKVPRIFLGGVGLILFLLTGGITMLLPM